jgi:Bor protein
MFVGTSHHIHPTFQQRLLRLTNKRMALVRGAFRVGMMIALVFSSGCYHFRVAAPDPRPASPSQYETIHVLFWGLLQPTVSAGNCSISNALDQVTVTNNFGYVFLTFVTLGMWAPMDVEWQCAKEASPDIKEKL